MPQPLEGSQAVARAVARCRPEVVAAYPITPQTHIVENLAGLIADGDCHAELVSVESEHSAASVVLGAAAAGARAYTASASQGVMLMSEVLYNISGLRIPVVMTCANRALSAPLSIWNDQQDAMAVRDAGWIQLFCADIQEAVDTHIQAFRIAQETELPVMVCMDGFTLTHTLEPVEVPPAETVDAFLPPFEFARALDPAQPLSHGTLVGPDHFPEARADHHAALLASAETIRTADREWEAATGRGWGGLLESRGDPAAPVGILALGGVVGTLLDAVDEGLADRPVRILRLRALRPFPAAELAAACADLETLVVVERAISPGAGGVLTPEVKAALADAGLAPAVHGVAAGLGGRDIPLEILPRLVALADQAPDPFRIIDLEPDRLPASSVGPEAIEGGTP
ncbi:MAG: pyruvate ferredoxin oxidoreductase [Thiohalospira sp.]